MWTDELYDEIQSNDRVWYQTPQGQTKTAKAKFYGTYGWVCDRGQGQPVVVTDGVNYLGHKPAKNRKPDPIGRFLAS